MEDKKYGYPRYIRDQMYEAVAAGDWDDLITLARGAKDFDREVRLRDRARDSRDPAKFSH